MVKIEKLACTSLYLGWHNVVKTILNEHSYLYFFRYSSHIISLMFGTQKVRHRHNAMQPTTTKINIADGKSTGWLNLVSLTNRVYQAFKTYLPLYVEIADCDSI